MGGNVSMDAMARQHSVADEAAAWLATLTDNTCTNDERESFVAWLRRSNLHVEEFLRVSTLARRLSDPGALPGTDLEQLVALARSELAGEPRVAALPVGPRPPPTQRRAPRIWAIAACASVLAAIGLFLARDQLLPKIWQTPTYSTSVGELRSITLEDGSIVELNTLSSLRTHFTRSERRVQLLSGEAVFKVAKDAARPFRVSAGSAQIVAVGTAFNVYAQSSARTVVTVLEGRVRVRGQPADVRTTTPQRPESQELELARGEQAVVAAHTPISRATLADPQQVTLWTQRRLVFDETPLAEAAAEFARYSSMRIRVEDGKVGALHISGVFDATDPASLVQFVEAYGGVAAHADSRGWTLASTEIDADAEAVGAPE